MSENLLRISNIDLFGLVMDDVSIVDPNIKWQVRVASAVDENIATLTGTTEVNGVDPKPGDLLLIWQQTTSSQNGIYQARTGNWIKLHVNKKEYVASGPDGKDLDYRTWRYKEGDNSFKLLARRRIGAGRRRGANRQLEAQLGPDAKMARIYGFSFEGNYYGLSVPTIFLVHGEGELVTQKGEDTPNPARAPRKVEITGLAAAGFDFADSLRTWSYDQADYTIRMNVETGMFEQVLLDAMFDGGMDAAGMNARGMNARGMNARGMNARGMNARGMNARGMNARGGNSD